MSEFTSIPHIPGLFAQLAVRFHDASLACVVTSSVTLSAAPNQNVVCTLTRQRQRYLYVGCAVTERKAGGPTTNRSIEVFLSLF